MPSKIHLLSTDFDGTLVCRTGEPFLDVSCMKLIQDLQKQGAIWAINTGRSVDLLESGLLDFSFPFRPDFILTSERDVFRPGSNGSKWEAFGDWNHRCAREHAMLFTSATSVLKQVIDFVNQETKGRIIMTKPIPDGFHTITPHLVVTDGAKAFANFTVPEPSTVLLAPSEPSPPGDGTRR